MSFSIFCCVVLSMKAIRSPFFWVSFAMCAGVMSTALISPLYGIYKSEWLLQASDISVIYVVYMAGALSALLFLGQLSDRIGFRRVMQLSLVLVFLGTGLTMLAWDTLSLNLARFIVGVASSLMTTSASVGLRQLATGAHPSRAASMSSVLIAFGFGLGPLVGGVIGQWLPNPLITAYLPTMALSAIGFFALQRLDLPPHDRVVIPGKPASRAWLPKLIWSEREHSLAFILTNACAFLAFGVFGLYASMSPLFLEQMIDWKGPFISGISIAVILFLSSAAQLMTRRLPLHWCGTFGLLALALCCGLLLLNLDQKSPWILAAGLLITAFGHGMTLLSGINMVGRIAQPHNHAGLLSTYLVLGYIGSMLPVLGVGWIADHWGLHLAVSIFCYGVIALAVLTAMMFFRHPHMQRVS
ncbi:MFS transporter [Oceanospirillum linum]|nr:MFS transporter [Oceanospirillum linum]SEG44311.1 Predicted arabinose efflux permease, MFS family [Oleiphilus messinensis]SMP34285.1 Predicted arabinose efflux permease, MFS family [Oceanospirillum linum]